MTEIFPTPGQVREGRRASWGTTPSAPLVDDEAARAARVAAGIATMRRHDELARADLDRAVGVLAPLFGRDDLPGHLRADLATLLHDCKVLCGPMVP